MTTKAGKWLCPGCGKVSASWYNYAAHVTLHKTICDSPWICKLPPLTKKKYIDIHNGKLICGKRCSTKHNLIKHLKALHHKHNIVDLHQTYGGGYGSNYGGSSGRYKYVYGGSRAVAVPMMVYLLMFLCYLYANTYTFIVVFLCLSANYFV